MNSFAVVTSPDFPSDTDRVSWGVVELMVTDLERAVTFWTTALGLITRDRAEPGVALGTSERTLIVLHSGASRPVTPQYTGLYHVAIGVRTQAAFSRILGRLIALKVQVSPTDHLLAKSLYIADPDGLEIEITLETPERFGRFGDMSRGFALFDKDGKPHSGRAALDVAVELAHAQGADLMAPLSDDTYLAHMHFKVAAIEPALQWFERIGFARHLTMANMGFADMGAGAPKTHRLAVNIWAGPNRPPAPDDMARLVRYEVLAHDPLVAGKALHLVDPAGVPVTISPAFD